jgi:hypothetical protein
MILKNERSGLIFFRRYFNEITRKKKTSGWTCFAGEIFYNMFITKEHLTYEGRLKIRSLIGKL